MTDTLDPRSWLYPTPRGLYCKPGDFYIDPAVAVPRAVVTHGHGDHARPGHRAALATPETLAIMRTRFEGMPAYYYLASTQPIDTIAPPQALARYGVGISYLYPSAVGSHHDPRFFLDAARRHLKRAGLYAENPGSIDFLSETLFRARVPVPASVPRGRYNVEVYLFRDSQVVSVQSTPFFVDATGLERRLFNMAHNAPLFYGLACVAMAMMLGWISAVLFRRPD